MVLFVTDRAMEAHACPWDQQHIEVPTRLTRVLDRLESSGVLAGVTPVFSRPATKEELASVHTQEYIDKVNSTAGMTEAEQEAFSSGMEDMYFNGRTAEMAALSAGCAIDLTKRVWQEKSVGFAAIRPPGHHAFADRGCGFCVYNNVAIAAKQAQLAGAAKIVIVDWDVHAGQGTQECIEQMEGVKLVSIHRFEHGTFWPNLPQSAVDNKFSNTVNIPLNLLGEGDSAFMAIMQTIILPLIDDHQPDIILVSCGFDAALGDPQGEMRVTPAGYGTMTRMLMATGRPLALLLEGGYFLPSVAAGAEYVMRALNGEEMPRIDREKLSPEILTSIRRALRRFAPSFPSYARLLGVLDQCRSECGSGEVEREEERCAEYTGARDCDFPYPTRGLYVPDHVKMAANGASHEAELNRLLEGYKEKREGRKVVLSTSADFDIQFDFKEDSLHLTCHPDIQMLVYRQIALSFDPFLAPPPATTPPPLSSDQLAAVSVALSRFLTHPAFYKVSLVQLLR